MIDNTDFSILDCINRQDRPLWKNKIHQHIVENEDSYPLDGGVSVQTVGRRVDRLNEEGYLENAIISPNELKRDLIIAFKLTEKGLDALKEKREDLLQDAVKQKIFGSETEATIQKPALLALLQRHFGLDDDVSQRLDENHEEGELITLLALHYAKKELKTSIQGNNLLQMSDADPQGDDLNDLLKI